MYFSPFLSLAERSPKIAFSKNTENLTTTDFIFPSYAMDLPYKLWAEYPILSLTLTVNSIRHSTESDPGGEGHSKEFRQGCSCYFFGFEI